MTKKLEVHKVYFRISYLNMIGIDLLLKGIKSPTMTYITLKDGTNLNLRTKDYDRNKNFIEKFYLNFFKNVSLTNHIFSLIPYCDDDDLIEFDLIKKQSDIIPNFI